MCFARHDRRHEILASEDFRCWFGRCFGFLGVSVTCGDGGVLDFLEMTTRTTSEDERSALSPIFKSEGVLLTVGFPTSGFVADGVVANFRRFTLWHEFPLVEVFTRGSFGDLIAYANVLSYENFRYFARDLEVSHPRESFPMNVRLTLSSYYYALIKFLDALGPVGAIRFVLYADAKEAEFRMSSSLRRFDDPASARESLVIGGARAALERRFGIEGG